MPKRDDIHSVLVIGSGPIVIGQACEFDYSGTQACRVLKQEGVRVILVNSNPATIMTDPDFADATYVEPITWQVIETIIAKEKPDAILPTLGGQTALNAAIAAARARHPREVRRRAHRRQVRGDPEGRGPPDLQGAGHRGRRRGRALATSRTPSTRPSTSPRTSATRSSSARRSRWAASAPASRTRRDELRRIVGDGLHQSPTSEVLLEESILGWKEYELELMRDTADNTVVVCSIENVDPVGVHTGDSITVAPALTLTDREYQKLRDIGIDIIRAVGVDTGGCNIQFAVDPANGRIIVIEMNPRVSRSSALASKATGFPIAKIAAKLAIGYRLDEIPNDITRGHAGELRADARLRRRQGAAVRLREVPGRRPDAHDDHEVASARRWRSAATSPPRCRRRCARSRSGVRRFHWGRRVAQRGGAARGRSQTPTDGRIVDVQQALRLGATRRAGLRGHQDRPLVPRPDRPDQRGRRCRSATRRLSTPTRSATRRTTASPTPRSASCAASARPTCARCGTSSASARSTRRSTPARASSRRSRRTTTRATTRRPRSRRATPARWSSSAPARTASARASSSTTPACTPRSPCTTPASRRS